MTSRFCYSYVRHPNEPICYESCLSNKSCMTTSTLSTMATLSTVVNNSKGASSQTFLLARQCQQHQQNRDQRIQEKVSTLIGTASQVNSSLQGQLANEVETRYRPYERRAPEFIPSSVMELEMRTRNIGVPIPTMTIMNCKGVQFVTK